MVDVADAPDSTVKMVGLELMLKSPTITVTLAEWETPPGPVPVTTTE